MRNIVGVLPSLLVLGAVVIGPSIATAQENASVEGFGGLSMNGLPSATPSPSFGGTVTFSVVPGIEIVGEAGRLGNVLPTLPSAAFSLARTGLHASAMYGEAGARFVVAPASVFTPYAEATAGVARLHLRSDQLGSAANAAMSMALGLVEGTTPTLGAGAGILLHGGPVLFDVGYRYKQLFADDAMRIALGFGQPLRTHEVRVGVGVRF
jgi:opacity protein-like surface antigen